MGGTDEEMTAGGPPLPIGTVTLLLADVEGSTRLWESDPAAMTGAVARLDEALATLVPQHHGARPVEQGEGDSFVIAFSRASDAVACALDLQLIDLVPIKLRVGIHTGEVQLRDEDNYIGPAINRCARLRGLAHGGQTVVSQVTHDIVVDRLPERSWLADLGTYRMRDLDRPERVHQLCHADLSNEFPELRSLDAVPNNLPVQLTTFVGRAAELEEMHHLLQDTRLLTLTGAGGAGKTRLALHLGADRAAALASGVWHVDLAPIIDPDLVATTVMRALGYRDEVDRSPLDTIVRHVQERDVLVILDNCEHLIAACAQLSEDLLRACPRLVIVATSREPLGIGGEVAYRVPSLRLPTSVDVDSEALQLFADRARRARPSFEITEANRDAVVQICTRLDGLPLAIELAAARVRAFSAEQIADGLHDRFRLLTGGARTSVPRQQTLRASVDWSYHLLTPSERELFERLSVFAASFDFEAAEAVGSGDTLERHHVFDLLALLVDKSLVIVDEDDGGIRYRLLETIRQYALDRLTEAGGVEGVRRAHRDHYLERVASLPLFTVDEDLRDRYSDDLDNFRLAIQWSLECGEVHEATRLVIHLLPVWSHGRHIEGRSWYEAVLPHVADEHATVRAWALGTAAVLDTMALLPTAITRSEESLSLTLELGDPSGMSLAYGAFATARLYVAGVPEWDAFDRAIELARVAGAESSLGQALHSKSLAKLNFGDPREAEELAREALGIFRALGAPPFVRTARLVVGAAALLRGDLEATREAYEDLVDECRARTDTVNLVNALAVSGWARAIAGDLERARSETAEARALASAYGVSLFEAGSSFACGVSALAAGDAAAALEDFMRLSNLTSAIWPTWGLAYRAIAELACSDRSAARSSSEEALQRSRQEPQPRLSGSTQFIRALVAFVDGDLETAESLAHRSLLVLRDLGDSNGVADSLELVASIAPSASAVRLFGCAERLRQDQGTIRMRVFDQWFMPVIDALRTEVTADEFDRAWAEGAAMSMDEAVAYAQRGRGERKRPSTGWASLTPAELDVVRLVAEGLSNKHIAEKLFISPRTVQAHLTHVYNKLNLTSRVQLATEAAAHT